MASGAALQVPPTLFLTDQDVRQVFDWKAAIDALRQAYGMDSDEAMFPPRTMARGPGNWLRTLSGCLPDGQYMGSKQIAVSTTKRWGNYLISLFDRRTVGLAALLDGNFITGARTAATSALAADALSRPGRLKLAVLGAGFEAKMHVRALAALDRVASIAVYSPTEASRERFAAEAEADLRLPAAAAAHPQDIVGEADMVLCAARSRDETPILHGQWLPADAVVISIGSTLPEQREIDPATVERAELIVADMVDEVAHDTGDMIAATAAGVAFRAKLHPLAHLIGGRLPLSPGDHGIRLYKSVGAGLQDLAVAAMCFERARALGIGMTLPASIQPVQK